MAPAASSTTGALSFAAAKRVCTAQELERLACAFLNTEEHMKFDTEAAAAQFGTSAKPESFKRVLQNTIKKIRDATANEDSGSDVGEGDGTKQTSTSVKGKGGRKRKSLNSDAVADGEDEETTMPVSKKGKLAKKTSPKDSPEEVQDGEVGNEVHGEGVVNGWMAVNGSERNTLVKMETVGEYAS